MAEHIPICFLCFSYGLPMIILVLSFLVLSNIKYQPRTPRPNPWVRKCVRWNFSTHWALRAESFFDGFPFGIHISRFLENMNPISKLFNNLLDRSSFCPVGRCLFHRKKTKILRYEKSSFPQIFFGNDLCFSLIISGLLGFQKIIKMVSGLMDRSKIRKS